MTNRDTDDELLEALGRHARERQQREALRPLSDDFQRRMAAQIKQAVSEDEASEAATPPPRPARAGPWLALAASVLAAVGLSVALVTRDATAPLPGYTLEFRGGAQVRSATGNAPLQVGDRLDVVLRPEAATDEPLALSAFRLDAKRLVPLDLTARWSDEGAVRLTATLDASLDLQPGPQRWLIVVARQGEAPSLETLGDLDGDARRDDWQAFVLRFDLVP